MVPCISCPQSTHYNATVDPVGKKEVFCGCQHLCLLWIVLISAEWLLSSLSHFMGGLLNLGSMPLDGLLNRSVAGLGNLGLMSVYLICNKEMHIYYH